MTLEEIRKKYGINTTDKKTTQSEENSTGGKMTLDEIRKKYGLSSGVDQDYINSFVADTEKYSSADMADSYRVWNELDLGKRAGAIRGWLDKNKTKYTDQNAYKQFSDAIDSYLNIGKEYSSFADEKAYGDWYKSYQTNLAKDEEMRNTDLEALAESITRGEEYSKIYNEESKMIPALEASIARKEQDLKYGWLTPYEKDKLTKELAAEKADLERRKNTISMFDVEALNSLSQKRGFYEEAKKFQELEKYKELAALPDFAVNSQYDESNRYGDPVPAVTPGQYTDTGYTDIKYAFINGDLNARSIKHNEISSYGLGGASVSWSFYEQMTPEEVSIFNYLYNTQSPEEAYKYVDLLSTELNYRDRMAEQEKWATYAEETPALASIFSVLTAPLKGVSYVGQVADFIDDGKIDENAGYNKFSHLNSAIRNQVSSDIEKNWGKVGSFAYQTGMSMADFLFTTGVSGGSSAMSLAIMGTGAAADTVITAKDRGLSDSQAFLLGTIAGAAEIITEKVSLDALLDATKLSENALGYFLKNVLAEGSEEVGSSLINLVADVLISQDKSEWQTAVDAFMAENPDASDKEAFWHVMGEQALSLGLDFLGGAISGGAMGGGAIGINALANNVAYNKAVKQHGQTIIENGGVDPLRELALDVAGVDKYAIEERTKDQNKLAKLAGKVEKKASAKNVGRLSAQLETTMFEQTDSDLNVDKIAELYAAREGKKLNEVLNSVKKSDTINESEVISDESTDSVHLRDGSERNDGQNTEESVFDLESSTGENKSWRKNEVFADSEAARLVNEGREVSVASLGILRGSDKHTVRLVDEGSETATMKQARARASERGLNVKFFVGDNLVMADSDGKLFAARGYILGNTMLVRADHPYYTSDQITRHEIGHDMIAKGEVNIKDVQNRLKKVVGEENVEAIADRYATAYEGTNLTPEEIWEECICDSLGDMNIFASDKTISEFMAPAMTEVKSATENTAKSPTQTRGSPEGKASRETKKKNGKLAKYLPDSKVGKSNSEYIHHQLMNLYSGVSDGIADGIAIEQGKKVYIVDSGREKGKLDFGVRRTKTINDSRLRQDFIRSTNDDTISKGNVSNELLERLGYGKRSDLGRNLRRELGAELQADTGKSENQQGGVSQENADGKRGLTEGKASRELDSLGNELTNEQIEYFKNSKVRDTNGNLLVVRHGTETEFNIFDFSKAGKNGKAEGYGFYFSDEMEITKRYGSIQKEVYLNITKPLYNNKRTITKAELKKLVNALIDFDLKKYSSDGLIWQDSFLSNYLDTYEFNKSRQYAVQEFINQIWEYNDNDQDLVFEVAQADGRMYESATMQEFYDVLGKSIGYDGIIAEWSHPDGNSNVYVTFRSEQSKNVSNKAPTSNPDIRFSRELDTAYLTAVENGDMKTAQKMVDEAAKKAGYTIKSYHGTLAKDFTEFKKSFIGSRFNYDDKGFFFIDRKSIAEDYASSAFDSSKKGRVLDVYLRVKKPLLVDKQFCLREGLGNPFRDDDAIGVWDAYLEFFKEEAEARRADGIILDDGMSKMTVVFDGEQIKSADPITYDDNGDVIPLSERFNPKNSDIRYSRELDVIDYIDEQAEREGRERVGVEPLSNREILANALESIAQNEIEQKKLKEYKDNISKMNAQSAKLAELKKEIKELTFGKGKKNPEKLKALKAEATKTENRINLYDKKLLSLETASVLKDVLEREKRKAYSRAAQKGREAMHRKVEGRHKTEMRHKIKNVAHELDALLNRGTKERNVKKGQSELVRRVLDLSDMLFATDDELIVGGIVTDLSDREKLAVAEFKALYDEYHSYDESVTENKEKRKELRTQMNEKKKALTEALERERKRISKAKASDIFDALAKEYEALKNSEYSYIRNAFDNDTLEHIKKLGEDVGTTLVKDMTLDQMESVYKAFRMVKTMVSNSNKFFNEEIKESAEKAGQKALSEVRSHGHKEGFTKAGKAVSELAWNNLKPIYLMERIGSKTLQDLFQNILNAESEWAKFTAESQAFIEEQKEKFGYDKWDLKKKWTFKTETGLEYELNLEQMFSIYAYAKRGDQALGHLQNDGFVFDKVTIKKKGVEIELNDKTAYKVTNAALEQIFGKEGILTEDQKAFVDAMQKYLSDDLAKRGNAVSNKLYGIDLFGEEYYLGIRSEGAYLERAREQNKGTAKMKNRGFTKSTQKNARNAIVLSEFTDLWSGHVIEMNEYAAFTLPLEDFYRVYNYQNDSSDTTNKTGVIPAIDNAYGEAATKAIDRLLDDINGGAKTDYVEGAGKKLIGLFKKAKVMLSLSVIVQQPSAIVRAMSIINPKYFVGQKTVKTEPKLWEEMKKYAPVAIIKEMGYFDTGMGYIAKEWVRGNKTFKDRVDDIISWAPAKADEITWRAIWKAVKRETLHNNPKMNPTSEEFLALCGKRFEEIIRLTQVYDSTLSRSANMRNKSVFMQMATSFMAEPTTSINMLEMAVRSGDIKRIGATVAAVYGSYLLNAILVALPYAARDDDEDETFTEKYFSALTESFLSNAIPLTSLPFVKDLWSIAQGYDVERLDMALWADFADSLVSLAAWGMKDDKDTGALIDIIVDVVGGFANLTGIPFKNLVREAKGIINFAQTLTKDFTTERNTTWNSLGDALEQSLKDSTPIVGRLMQESKADKLFDAIMAGDKNYTERLKDSYSSEGAYESAIRKTIGEKYKSGEITRAKATSMLTKYGDYDENDAYWKLKEWDYKKRYGDDAEWSKYSEFYTAVKTGKNLKAVIKDYTDHGVSKESLASQITSYYKPLYKKMSKAQRANIKGYLLNAYQLLGYKRADKSKDIDNWLKDK